MEPRRVHLEPAATELPDDSLMGVAVQATRVSAEGDEAYHDLVSDPAEPPVRVGFRWVDGEVRTDVDDDGSPVFVRAGIRGVAGRRADTGEWPQRVTRQS